MEMQKAGNIIFIMFLLIGTLISLLNNVSEVISSILVGILMMVLYTLFFILSLRFFWIKPPKFIRKSAQNPAQLFDEFGHWPFLYGIFVYSFFASIFIGAIFLAAIKKILNLDYDTSGLFYNLFFITTAIYSVFYFMYHVAEKDISTKIIKARIRLYLAIATTITVGLFGIATKEFLTPLITYLGMGFAWLSFFVEKIESES
ncbi:hypothetical protein V3851_08610 [Paenibacillus sp. M1]|uniref:Uncharacterized protein n=1 Tax=Paenibacillus haidiansis TaxID=1574488 RepID=A0ABU7VQ75_9BACL